MKPWPKSIQAWRSRRQLHSLERWEQIRAKGKARYVFQTTLTYGVTVAGVTDVVSRFFGTDPISLAQAIFYVLTGIVIAVDGWNAMEGKYKNALIDARVKASPTAQTLSQRNTKKDLTSL